MNDAATLDAPAEAATTGIGSTGAPLGFQVLAVASIEASPTNPRKTFDPKKHEELTDSVRQHGVLQPILVRPHPARRGKYELIAGERRWRAAKAAKLATIPVMVKELNDLQTLEVQVIENLQREDIHPLEEAEGYEVLLNKHGFTVEQLAGKVGKSKAYVYARIKLCALSPDARDSFMDGELDASTALLVARIPVPALQKQALKEIATGGEWLEGNKRAPMSYRRAAAHVRERYMLRLEQAPFDVKAMYLAKNKANPIAGACVDCPKRTGNAPDLFGDVDSDNVCTDPECFAQKREAHGDRVAEEARAKGLEVVTGKDAKKILPHTYSNPAGFVKLTDHNYSDEKNRTWAKILGKEAKDKVVLVERPDQPGTFEELVRDKDVAAILKAKGIEAPKKKRSPFEPSPAERKADLEREVASQATRRAYLALRNKIAGGISNVDLRAIVWLQLDMNSDMPNDLVELWGLTEECTEEDFKAAVEKAEGAALLQMAFDVLVGGYGFYGHRGDKIMELATMHGVDVKAIEKEVREELKAKAKSKGKAKGEENES